MTCRHKDAIPLHGSKKLAVVRCQCGKKFEGDPSKPNTPKWVLAANERYLTALKIKSSMMKADKVKE